MQDIAQKVQQEMDSYVEAIKKIYRGGRGIGLETLLPTTDCQDDREWIVGRGTDHHKLNSSFLWLLPCESLRL